MFALKVQRHRPGHKPLCTVWFNFNTSTHSQRTSAGSPKAAKYLQFSLKKKEEDEETAHTTAWLSLLLFFLITRVKVERSSLTWGSFHDFCSVALSASASFTIVGKECKKVSWQHRRRYFSAKSLLFFIIFYFLLQKTMIDTNNALGYAWEVSSDFWALTEGTGWLPMCYLSALFFSRWVLIRFYRFAGRLVPLVSMCVVIIYIYTNL